MTEPARSGPTPIGAGRESEALLRVENLTVRFGGVVACDDVTLTCAAGRITALLGPNGAGKTTCFNAITGAQETASGRITFLDHDVSSYSAHRRARMGLARTFQNLAVVPELTVLDNVIIGAARFRNYGLLSAGLSLPRVHRRDRHLRQLADAALKLLGLDEVRDLPAASLPYGALRRLEIARALALGPRLLLLDEPAAGLDTGESEELADALRALNRTWGLAMLVVEHDLSLIRRVADDAYVLDFGVLLAGGPIENVLHHPAVIRAYLGAHAGA